MVVMAFSGGHQHVEMMGMDSKENGDIKDEWANPPASPIEVLQQLSQEAVRMAGEAWRSAGDTPFMEQVHRHRRAHSEVVSSLQRRCQSTGNFQKWKGHWQKALHWRGRGFRGDSQFSSFDPEILANQKRQWYKLNSKTLDPEKYKEPTALFEHFVVAGLRPDANLDVVEDAFIRRKKWERKVDKPEQLDPKSGKDNQPSLPTLEPQVLFMYPPGKKTSLRLKDLAAFCFPGGVKAGILERTPSLSELNELVYGQEHLYRDDLSFIFSLKVADNATVYGVCLQVQELVQRPPIMYGCSSPLSQSHSGSSKFLVSAPRCYCILTRVPFFELHYEMLNSIIAQERLNRITKFVNEMALADYVPSQSISKDHANENGDSPSAESDADWMASAIPIDSAITLTAAAAGIISDEEASSRWEYSPRSDASDPAQLDKESSKNVQAFDDSASETSDIRSNSGHTPDVRPYVLRNQSVECLRSFESLFSPARSMGSEEDDEIYYNHEEDLKDDFIMEWARENKNDLLQIVCGYHCLHLPDRGGRVVFQPLEHLQTIEYQRPPFSSLGFSDKYLDLNLKDSKEASQVNLKLATAEEAIALSLWSTAAICRVLSLENVLALVTGVLLEKQVVVVCPNLGVLSAVVLSLIPIIRPFEWQSLFLPILPDKMLDFLDAPVPFIAGIQDKPTDLRMKTSNLVQVNVLKDQVISCNLPLLPRRKELISELRPIHSTLSSEDQKNPVYKCNEMQAEAATQFLAIIKRHLESLCSDMRLHTITSVQSNNDKVSLLLKDSFIDSFPSRDQSFIKLFVETQLFTVLSDSRLSSYENE